MIAVPAVSSSAAQSNDPHPLDAVTGGAFSAPTSGERAARIRDWLAQDPSPEQMQEVFRQLGARDKGATRPLKERLDEIKRAKGQALLAAEWADRARALLALPRLNIADAMAWQRDAAKAGAPLSREPLAAIRSELAERIRVIEDLQNRAQVQREAAVLLAQRIEVLSTKSWRDAQAGLDVLHADVQAWQAQAQALTVDANWPSVDGKFPPLLEASKVQLLAVWDAFGAALAQAAAAAADANAPLPPVLVWANELRAERGVSTEPAPPSRVEHAVDNEMRAKSAQTVRDALSNLQQELDQGHGKASVGAAAALRGALKEHGRFIDAALEARVHAALAAAGDLEGWQRWRADQLREELLVRAEALLQRPADQPLAGRKLQERLRQLREQWKQTDQGGAPNHALWKRFDHACNEAHKQVEAWVDRVKAEAAEHRAQRLALIEEVRAWGSANAGLTDWKAFGRALHQFGERWRNAGHLGDKAFAELQPQWKEAIAVAAAPLETEQRASVERRQALIEQAAQLGAATPLRIDAVRALQQRWQAEAQAVPLERRLEQKLWDAFRKPIDDAFARKTEEREKAAAAISGRDRAVLDAAKALDAAVAAGDAAAIRTATSALDAAMRAASADAAPQTGTPGAVAGAPSAASVAGAEPVQGAPLSLQAPDGEAAPIVAAAQPQDNKPQDKESEEPLADAAAPEPAPPPKPAPKPVVAMRGDDRPGLKRPEAARQAGGFSGDRRGASRGAPRFGERGGERGGDSRSGTRREDARAGRPGSPFPDPRERGPRLGDQAFRAQRDARQHAELALKRLAAQAHGEALTQLLAAWEQRDASQMPGAQALGARVAAATRSLWVQALTAASQSQGAAEALLRIEIAADQPTPAEHLEARRALQLQLLTRRHDPAPAQTWGQDVARVLAASFDAGSARRLQGALKLLLGR
ncbi:MAG: DUF349 domain-containing protein [Proteobacteria bacterium]|nr:DUF349 domain-containing protein [Pseudomonadota bacterium]